MLLVSAVTASAAETPEAVLWSQWCETTRIDSGDPSASWLQLDGWTAVEGKNTGFIQAQQGSALLLLLRSGESRGLEVVARGRGRLLAAVNGHRLGERDLASSWTALRWKVPAEAILEGPNVLRLERRGPAPGGFDVKRLGIDPSPSCGRKLSRTALITPPWPVRLEDDQVLVLRRTWSRPSRLDLEAEMRWPATSVTVFCLSPHRSSPLRTVSGGSMTRVSERLALNGECADGRGVVVVGHGPSTTQITAADVRPRGRLGWRRWIDLIMALAVMASAALLWALRERLARVGRDNAQMWRDVVAVVGVALLVRLAFWIAYPRPGYAADSWEYLLNAGRLAAGQASFWGDTIWHSWQTYLRPPGYFLFLALTGASPRAGLQPAVVLQLVFSALTAGATYLVARAHFGRLSALAAGVFFALYVPSIGTFSSLMTEPLYMLLTVSALAALSWAATSPQRATAAVSGALFGLAALVRAGPIPLGIAAAALLVPALGWRRGLRSAAWLLACMACVALPWSVRNSILLRMPMGISNISVPNLLIGHPDPRFVSTRGLDLDSDAGSVEYRRRVATANKDGELTKRSTEIVGAVMSRIVLQPAATAKRAWSSTTTMVTPLPDSYLRQVLGDHRVEPIAWLTSLANAQLLVVLVTGLAGMLLSLGTRSTWPLLGWLVLSYISVSLLFFPEPRFLLHMTPPAMVFSGAALERLLGTGTRRGVGGD